MRQKTLLYLYIIFIGGITTMQSASIELSQKTKQIQDAKKTKLSLEASHAKHIIDFEKNLGNSELTKSWIIVLKKKPEKKKNNILLESSLEDTFCLIQNTFILAQEAWSKNREEHAKYLCIMIQETNTALLKKHGGIILDYNINECIDDYQSFRDFKANVDTFYRKHFLQSSQKTNFFNALFF